MSYNINIQEFWPSTILVSVITFHIILKTVTLFTKENQKIPRFTKQSKVDHLLKSTNSNRRQKVLKKVDKELYFKKIFSIEICPKAIDFLEQLHLSGFTTVRDIQLLRKFLVLVDQEYKIQFSLIDKLQAWYSVTISGLLLLLGALYSIIFYIKSKELFPSLIPILIFTLLVFFTSIDFRNYKHAQKLKKTLALS
ncbi:hypothetical protein AKN92_11540 [Thiopseudomonas alkaliphila]|nr:hypothetical protein AKN92_11540 [Thiopseudomonas alkaliphila]